MSKGPACRGKMWSLIGKVKKASEKIDTYGQVYRQTD